MTLPERISPPLPFSEFSEIIDARSPQEFAQDHLPGSINLPVLNDKQHQEIGLLHASDPFTARRQGATLVTENIHAHLSGLLAHKPRDYAPLIYCWRGGMRSSSFAITLRAIGWRARVIDGGYKSWRRWLVADLDHKIALTAPPLVVLAGLTGCGKTRLLHALKKQGAQTLDLEGLANHKGSILGSPTAGEQPSQKRFETKLWEDFSSYDPSRPVFTEAESNRIGKIQLPSSLWRRLGEARVTQVHLPVAERAKFLARDYPHFIDHPQHLKSTLDGLRRLRGNELVDSWHSQIDARQWPDFLESILLHHYDSAYRRPGAEDSIYAEPEHHLHLKNSTPQVFEESAAALLEHFS